MKKDKALSDKTLGINDRDIIDAEVIEVEDWGQNHPNFIESNTQAITIEELTTKNVIPTFSDNTLTLSHQNFIGAVGKMAEQVFGELTPVEIRVSHPIIGRIPSAQHKKANELLDEEKTVFYQRMAWCCRVKNITREINGQTVHLVIPDALPQLIHSVIMKAQKSSVFRVIIQECQEFATKRWQPHRPSCRPSSWQRRKRR